MRTISINVSRKILADVSSGIYRTPANALKELVSNAFDAGANKVIISTNVPYFDVFTCEDNGIGMSSKDFEKIMNRIGNSRKRIEIEQNIFDRPIIGKIGIGILAIAQICNKFTVISKRTESKYYFQATIDLKQFDEIEKETILQKENSNIDLGKYEIEDTLIDEIDEKRQYTKIIMEDIKPGFKEKLIEEEGKRKFGIKEQAKKSDAINNFIENTKVSSFIKLSQYDQLVWELCINCPIEYSENGPLPNNKEWQNEIDKLKKYNFKLIFDGFELRKPLRFPTDNTLNDEGVDYKLYPLIKFDHIINKQKLKFTGYIFSQRKKIQPSEAIGILIRIKGVAIGGYDKTFLHYPKAEGPMINLLSGEIFVEDGLEDALNIDRNSFNETHPHYLKIQNFLWNILAGNEKVEGIFTDIRKRSKIRNDIKREKESEKNFNKLMETIQNYFNINIKIDRKKINNSEPYILNNSNNKLIFYENNFWSKNQNTRTKQEQLIYTIVCTRIASDSIELFEKNLLKVLAKIS